MVNNNMSSARVYIGNLPKGTSERELHRLFCNLGPIREVAVKSGGQYGFVEYERRKDAEAAVREMNLCDVGGCRIRVEHTLTNQRRSGHSSTERSSRSDRTSKSGSRREREKGGRLTSPVQLASPASLMAASLPQNMMYAYMPGPNGTLQMVPMPMPVGAPRPLIPERSSTTSRHKRSRRSRSYSPQAPPPPLLPPRRREVPKLTRWRVIVQNLSSRVTWVELKEFFGRVAKITYADCNDDYKGEGFICFARERGLHRALKELEGKEIRGRPIHLLDDSSCHPPPDQFRHSRSPAKRTRCSSRSQSAEQLVSVKRERRSRSSSEEEEDVQNGDRSEEEEEGSAVESDRGSNSRSDSKSESRSCTNASPVGSAKHCKYEA